jgi:hypothetical protein
MKRKLLIETPVCSQERLVIISTQPACPLLKKGLGHLLQLSLLSFIYSHFIYLYCQLPLKTYLLVFTVISQSKLLINTFCSLLGLTLLFIESTMIHPLYLWVINRPLGFFSSRRIYRRRGSIRRWASWPHHLVAWPEARPCRPMVWPAPGSPPSLLWALSRVEKNRNFGFCFVQFQEYFPCSFSETQKSRK